MAINAPTAMQAMISGMASFCRIDRCIIKLRELSLLFSLDRCWGVASANPVELI